MGLLSRSTVRKGVFILLLGVAGLYGFIVAGVWAIQDRLLFGRRSAAIVQTPDALKWAYEDVWCETPGGRTHGWWIPQENARGAVLYSHGSGKNISHYLDDMAFLRDLGFSILMYDYGGYGQSTGNPSEARCYADIRAMWNHLAHVRRIPPERIVLMGSSMGGGVTADLAAEVAAGAVILEATFTAIPDVVSDAHPWIPARLIARHRFANIEKAGRIRSPVLIIHSVDDATVPFAQARMLYERITAPKTFLEIHGSHGGGKFTSREQYAAGLGAFLGETINLDLAVKIGFYVLSSGCRGPCGRNGQENQSPCG